MKKSLFFVMFGLLLSYVSAWGTEVGTLAELKSAIATPNAQITLTAIIDVTEDLDLNGATITEAKGLYLRIPSDASVVLKNGTINNPFTSVLSGSGSALYINNGGKVTLRNISLSACAPVYFKTKGEVEIGTGVTFTSTATNHKIFEYSGNTKDAHKITLLSGTNLELNQVDQQIAMNNYYKFTINLGATLTLDGVVARSSATCNASIVNNGTLNIKKYFCVTTLDYSGDGDINISELTTGMRFSDAAFETLHVLDNLDNPSAYKFVKAATKVNNVKTIVTDVRLATDEIADVFAEYTDATLGNVEIDETVTNKVSLDFADAVNLAGSNELRLIKYVAYKGTIDITGKDIVFANGGLTVQNGSLTITGTGTIRSTNDANNTNCLFQVNGKATDAANYSTFTIGENVTIDGGYCAIGVFGTSNGANAYGVTVNMNGTLLNQKMAVTINGNVNATTGNVPVINLNGTINCYNVGAYAAGYGIWNVAGSITTTPAADRTKSSAFAAKSGQININDGAVLIGAGDGTRVEALGGGVISSGAALQLESNGVYAGGMDIAIADGATLRSNGGWYAIYEYVANANDPTAVNSIAVNGGSFEGGILVSQSLAANGGFVSGGHWSEDVTAHCASGYATEATGDVDYPYGVAVAGEKEKETTQTAVLVSADATSGEIEAAVSESDKVSSIPTASDNQIIISQNTDVVVAGENDVVEVKKLTVENGNTLTVKEGTTLKVGVGALHLDADATTPAVVVESGATLIVDGLIYGANESNLIFETGADNTGALLFSPTTEFITEDHPMATIKLTTTARQYGTGASDYVFDRFAIPTISGEETTFGVEGGTGSVVLYPGQSTFRQGVWKWDEGANDWATLTSFRQTEAMKGYQLTNNSRDGGVVYTFEGPLCGNANENYQFTDEGFNFYGNSYTADIDIKKFFEGFGDDMQVAVWVFDKYDNNSVKTITRRLYGRVKDGNGDAITNIHPMQAFLMYRNASGSGSVTIDYASAIWGNPKYGLVPASAPAVRTTGDEDYMTIQVSAAGVSDEVVLVRSSECTAALDNGDDVQKFMFESGAAIYATLGEEKLGVFASDNIDNTFLAFRAGDAEEYTLTFTGVQGGNYSIRDVMTGVVVPVVEGSTYTFSQDVNTTIAQRFEVLRMPNAATGAEQTKNNVTPTWQKVVNNGTLYITRDGQWFNVAGGRVK